MLCSYHIIEKNRVYLMLAVELLKLQMGLTNLLNACVAIVL